MIQGRGIRSMLLTVALTAACIVASGGLAASAQAATTPVKSETAVSTGASSFARLAVDPDATGTAKPLAATVKRGGTTADATINAPLPGFCSLAAAGPRSVAYCSVVFAATVYIYCDTGNYFYGYLPYAGIWEVIAYPCFAIGYDLF